VAFLACMHLALFLALSLSPGNFLVSSWKRRGERRRKGREMERGLGPPNILA